VIVYVTNEEETNKALTVCWGLVEAPQVSPKRMTSGAAPTITLTSASNTNIESSTKRSNTYPLTEAEPTGFEITFAPTLPWFCLEPKGDVRTRKKNRVTHISQRWSKITELKDNDEDVGQENKESCYQGVHSRRKPGLTLGLYSRMTTSSTWDLILDYLGFTFGLGFGFGSWVVWFIFFGLWSRVFFWSSLCVCHLWTLKDTCCSALRLLRSSRNPKAYTRVYYRNNNKRTTPTI
jgi:hypothetical protein